MKSIVLNESFRYFVYKCLTTNLSRDLFRSTYYFVNQFNNTMDANPCGKNNDKAHYLTLQFNCHISTQK